MSAFTQAPRKLLLVILLEKGTVVRSGVDLLSSQDNTVKVRGFRVDLGGIEGTMDSCSAVRDHCMQARSEIHHLNHDQHMHADVVL